MKKYKKCKKNIYIVNFTLAGIGVGGRRRTAYSSPGGRGRGGLNLTRNSRRNTTINSNSSMFSNPQLENLLSGLTSNEAETLTRTAALIQHITFRDQRQGLYFF